MTEYTHKGAMRAPQAQWDILDPLLSSLGWWVLGNGVPKTNVDGSSNVTHRAMNAETMTAEQHGLASGAVWPAVQGFNNDQMSVLDDALAAQGLTREQFQISVLDYVRFADDWVSLMAMQSPDAPNGLFDIPSSMPD